MEENKVTLIQVITKLINLIGEAGVYKICNINTTDNTSPKQIVKLEAKYGVGHPYHYYDYILTAIMEDGRELKIRTEAKEIDNGHNCNYATEVTVDYDRNDKLHSWINFTINGWKYENLCNYKNLIKLDDDEIDIKELLRVKETLNTSITYQSMQRNLDESAVDAAWNSLDDVQRKILIKQIKSNKRK